VLVAVIDYPGRGLALGLFGGVLVAAPALDQP
jgi:hypothetical protein